MSELPKPQVPASNFVPQNLTASSSNIWQRQKKFSALRAGFFSSEFRGGCYRDFSLLDFSVFSLKYSFILQNFEGGAMEIFRCWTFRFFPVKYSFKFVKRHREQLKKASNHEKKNAREQRFGKPCAM
jgi:hypothetical protein